ncbi:hypothetical protein HKCCE2091_03330 [Rhodobacterales bacterium HKCCE2091]|nr:hypothetical protein [Rhodobacterales bacterium HKCCE2091]
MSDDPTETAGPERAGAWEYGAAAALVLLGGYMILEGLGFGVGTIRRMGPGFFPVAVGVGLAALAVGILSELRRGGVSRLNAPIRPLLFIIGSLVVFAATVEPLGMIPATILLVLIGSFADRSMTPLRAAISAVALAILGYLVFILGFDLPLNAF